MVRCRAFGAQLHALTLVPDLELSAAAVVNPNAICVVSPAISEPAGRLADLTRDANATASLDSAVLTRPEIGRAL